MGLGEHVDHGAWAKRGRCVYCACGARLFQGGSSVPKLERRRAIAAEFDATIEAFREQIRSGKLAGRLGKLRGETQRAVEADAAHPALGACAHRLVVDETMDQDGWLREAPAELGPGWTSRRRCLTCGLAYDRNTMLARLREAIRERHRLPASPWSAAERAEDLD